MKFFQYEARRGLTLYPLVCWHMGAPQSDVEFIKEHVARIADDPTARWVYMGDGGECTTKSSKGEIYKQTLSPNQQIDAFVELAKPILGKGLFGITGNHDRRIERDSGLDWAHALCVRLGIPYLENCAFMNLRLKVSKTQTTAFHCFFHHGIDSSSVLGGKINAAQRLERLVEADAIFSAHSHTCLDVPPNYVARLTHDGLAYREVRNFICGCAYDSRVPGYAEQKGYPPIIPAHLAVKFDATAGKSLHESKSMTSQIWRAKP